MARRHGDIQVAVAMKIPTHNQGCFKALLPWPGPQRVQHSGQSSCCLRLTKQATTSGGSHAKPQLQWLSPDRAQIAPPQVQHERFPRELIFGLNSRVWSPLPNLLTMASPSALGKRPAEEIVGFSKSPKPRDNIQWLQTY